MSDAVVKLEGAMTIAKAEGLQAELEEIFRNSQPTKLIANDVSRVDTSVMQLLVSFMNNMKSSGVSVEWEGVSDELVAGAKMLGLDQELNF